MRLREEEYIEAVKRVRVYQCCDFCDAEYLTTEGFCAAMPVGWVTFSHKRTQGTPQNRSVVCPECLKKLGEPIE